MSFKFQYRIVRELDKDRQLWFKECVDCHRLLPSDAFYRDRTGREDGLNLRCKICFFERNLKRSVAITTK